MDNDLHTLHTRRVPLWILRTAFGLCLFACVGFAHAKPKAALAAASTPSAALAPAATASRPAERSAARPNASGLSWRKGNFDYQASGKRLSEVLQDFASSQGLPAVIADGVEGVVHGTFNAPPEMFLRGISETYGTIWYHDGTALYFYPARAMQSKLFRLRGFTREQVEQLLGSLNLGDRRFPLRYNARERTLMAYGPPRHIEVVSAALESLDAGAAESNRVIVKVFPLRYASAADRQVGSTRVMGLVSTLRGIYGGGTASAEPHGNDPLGASRVVGKMQAMKSVFGSSKGGDGASRSPVESAVGAAAASRAPEPGSPGSDGRGLRSPVSEDDQPGFEADEGTNSIVVRGRISRMAEYGYLIQRLDQRPILVELEATIIDVSSDSIDSLGIDWSARSGRGSISSSSPGSGGTGGFVVNTLWGNAGRELMARVMALSSEGRARVVAKPKVLGVANRPAVMQEKRQATVRVAGNLDAQLYTVEAGTRLEVTPQVNESEGTVRMKLSLFIEDGQFEANVVDNVPVIKHSEIRTEAHVLEGESVLVGGITVEQQSEIGNGLPGARRLPLFGGLFRSSSSQSSRTERMFLITPRLLRDADRLPPVSDRQFDGVDLESSSRPR